MLGKRTLTWWEKPIKWIAYAYLKVTLPMKFVIAQAFMDLSKNVAVKMGYGEYVSFMLHRKKKMKPTKWGSATRFYGQSAASIIGSICGILFKFVEQLDELEDKIEFWASVEELARREKVIVKEAREKKMTLESADLALQAEDLKEKLASGDRKPTTFC